jgi:hypothetical protein
VAKRNTVAKAYERHVKAMQAAVGCITHGRFAGVVPKQVRLNAVYTLSLDQGDPVPLWSSAGRLTFSAGQRFRIIHDADVVDGPYRTTTVNYWYQYALLDGRELLTYHWTPEATDSAQRLYPHLHVGFGLLDAQGLFMPGTFSKLHIPTARVSLEAIVRFAIEELGVAPIPRNWNERLLRGEEALS